MFDLIRKHMRVLQWILVILIVPSFIFLGVEGYRGFDEGANQTVATVAGQSISQAEWDAAHRDQVERVRRQMPTADPKLFDTPEMKRQTLDSLIRERVMLAAADKLHLATTDERLQRLFATDPQFAPIRNPDGSVNRDALAAQGMSSEMFARRLRQELSVQQVLLGVSGTGVPSSMAADQAVDAFFQQREVVIQSFKTADYRAKVNPTDAEIEAFYKSPENAAQFQAPEQASVEYVVLDIESMKKGVSINDEDLQKYYAENASRYITPQERRASHILITADKGAPAPDRQAAKAKAESLLAEVRQSPDRFAELATKNSQDPGSAAKGGDLDFFSRGAMVKPFEDAAFALKVGETSDVVESDFGYHIIRLTDVRGGEKRSLDAVRSEIESEVRLQLAQKRFSEAAVEFTNLVYEQSDSLKPAIDKFNLQLQTAAGVTRQPAPNAKGPLASAKFLEALFSNDALRNKRNTDAVETGPSQLVSGRVVQYEAARTLALADVKERVRARVVEQQAAALARKEGEARLAALKQAPQTDMGIESRNVSRLQSQELGQALVEAVLGVPPAAMPAVVGVDLGTNGYVVAKVQKIVGRDPVVADPVQARTQYAGAWGDAETQSYYAALKLRLKAQIKDSAVSRAVKADTPP